MVNEVDTRSSKPPVSVVVVNYNAGLLLTECVRAALPQVSEVLVVDNASSDPSVEGCARQFADEPKLKIIRNDANLGFAAACNIGFSQAKDDFVLFLNPDCCLDGAAVSELLRALQADAAVGMVGGLLVNPDGSEQGGGRRAVPTPWRSFVRAFGLSRFARRWPKLFFDFHLHKQPLPDRPIEVEAISGACMLVKREAVADVGLWDEGYFMHCEDLDWCMRFRQKGWRILFVPDAKVVHYKGTSSKARPIFVEWHKHKGMMRFYLKFFRHQYPGVLMWLVGAGVWLRFGAMAIYYSLRHVGRVRPWAQMSGPFESEGASAQRSDVLPPPVIVTGATSQIGTFLIPHLVRGGFMVHAVTRRHVEGQTVPEGNVIWHKLDIVREPRSLNVPGAATLIHLAPLPTVRGLIDTLAAQGLRRLVAFSSTSRFTKLRSGAPEERAWANDLAQAEESVVESCALHGIKWTLFRPTLIYGAGLDKNVTTIAKFIHRFGFFPIVGEGNGLRQPVHADDLATACVTVLECPAAYNRAYDLSGGETLTYRKMVEAIFRALGKKPRIVRIPLQAFALLVKGASLVPAYKHINLEMVNRINLDLAFDHLAAKQDFGYSPRKFEFSERCWILRG